MVISLKRGWMLAAASVLLLASCGGSSDSSRARNAALSDAPPTITTISLPSMTLPLNIAVGPDGSVFTVNIVSDKLIKISPDGTVDTSFATIGGDQYGVDVDAAGNIYSVGLASSKITKVTKNGTVAYSEWVDYRPIALVAADDGTVYTANEGAHTVSRVSPDGTVTKEWATVNGSPSGIDLDADGNVVVSLTGTNTVVRIKQDGTQETFEVGREPTDLEVAPNGSIYVVNRMGRSLTVITPDGVIRTIALDAYNLTGIAIDKAGYVYVVDDGGSRVSRVGLDDSVITEWARAGGQSHKVAVGPDGTVYTADLSGDTVTRIVPAPVTPESSDTTATDLKPALILEFGPVESSPNGFTTQIQNFDPSFVYRISTSTIGIATISDDGRITVTGLIPGMEETVTVETTREGYLDGQSLVTGRSLESAPAEPTGDPANAEPTLDTMSPPESTPSTSDSTVDTTPASDTTSAGSESASTDTTPAASGSTPGDTTPTTPVTDSTPDSTPASTPAAPSGEVLVSVGDVAQIIAIGDETVAAVPPTAASRAVSNAMSDNPAAPTPILVNPATTEIACTATCVQAMLASVGAVEGEVIAVIGDAEPVTITAAAPALLKVGKEDTTIRFTVKPKGGKDVVVDIPVVHSDTAPEVKAGSSGSSDSNLTLYIAIIVFALLALALGAYVIRRRSPSTPDSSQSA